MEARDLAIMTPLLLTPACAPDRNTCADELANSSAREAVGLYVSGVMDDKKDGLTTHTITAVPDGDLGGNPDCIIVPEIGEPWDAEVKDDNPEGAPSELIITAEIDHSKVDSAELWCFTANDCSEHVVWNTWDDSGEYVQSPYLVLPQ